MAAETEKQTCELRAICSSTPQRLSDIECMCKLASYSSNENLDMTTTLPFWHVHTYYDHDNCLAKLLVISDLQIPTFTYAPSLTQ
eukprot:2551024-Amphidinium_carterae.1